MESADDVDPRGHVQDDDICKALVVMISQNIAQISHLNARIHGARRVFFTGNFLRHNGLALQTIVHTMQRWSQLDKQRGAEPTEAIFFRHEGYFGAIGAFLQTLDAEFVSDLGFSHTPAAETPPSSSRFSSAPPSSSTSAKTSPKAPRRTVSGPHPPASTLAKEPSAEAMTIAVPTCGSAFQSASLRRSQRGSPKASPKSSPSSLRKSRAAPAPER